MKVEVYYKDKKCEFEVDEEVNDIHDFLRQLSVQEFDSCEALSKVYSYLDRGIEPEYRESLDLSLLIIDILDVKVIVYKN